MAFEHLHAALRQFSLCHLPSLALMVGLPVFWLELYFFPSPQGHSSWMAWGFFISISGFVLATRLPDGGRRLREQMVLWGRQLLWIKVFTISAAVLALVYLAIGFYASLLPVHLVQENDALNYHITLPRQHLLAHSFAHIPWSVADLFLLPLDYALSPFWLNTVWPNKVIQFLFFLGVLGNVYQLTYLWSASRLRSVVALLAVMACHALAIQVGTAMLDMVMLYCFLAFLHSLYKGHLVLAAVECAFFLWSKAFIFPQMIVITFIMAAIYFLFMRKRGLIEIPALNGQAWRRWGGGLFISSLVIASPFLIKSFYYTGTPIYPFGVGLCKPIASYDAAHWQLIVDKAKACVSMKDAYGHGRSLIDFIQHWWLVAVPEKGVNNAFDYPVGLVYLLVLVPFMVVLCKKLSGKCIPVLSLFVVIWWMTWWLGSQQTRFLLVPISLMIILAIVNIPKMSRIFIALIIMCLGVETISLANAHRADWGKAGSDVVRAQDKDLMEACKDKEMISWDKVDVAYAPCRVNVVGDDAYFVISRYGGARQ